MNTSTQQPRTPEEVRDILMGKEDGGAAERAKWRWTALSAGPGMRSPQHERARQEGWHIAVPEREVGP